ncbi:hypothetical protein EC957_003259 [Mortierella hygrophila]|uniref:Uncharacterized protein n=1 Tax=Mortierella hygrophila TaxID=979708 RepID=A0A9P6F3H6_9FUNG|nr:hypothetical protein EC957_003259 [Mortierella hygrophila]
MYSGREIGYSLSDTNLPDKRSKRELVTDWLDQQTIVAPSDMVEAPEHLSLVQDGPNSNTANDNEPLHQFHHHHNAHHHHQQQQQQIQHQRQSIPAQLDPNQLYHQQSINNTGAQREPRQQQQAQQGQGQEHYPRVILRTNELFLPTNIVPNINTTPNSNSNISLTRNTPIQVTMQYAQTAASPPTYHPPQEPLGYEDQDQQDANHRRSLSLNNSGGRRVGARSRPQSQVYRKATPARFENLSLAELARQEHQMRRQHYQQHYHQHRQQQQHQQPQHQHQHQQYYHAPGSRPQSMYSNGYGAAASPRASTSPREVNQFVPPRHHQAHPRPHLPSIVMHQHQQQHRHPSDLRHSIVSSPKTSNVSRSAHDLAWERHCYYQQQQIQEDALAERKLIEQQQQHVQQQKRPQRPLSSVEGGLQVPLLQGSSSVVVRTSSLSRVSSISTTAVTGGNAASTIGRRTAVGKVALGSSGLSRSVSTSAIMDAKARAAKKDKSSHPNLKKNGKESPTTETETKPSAMDCKFLRLFRSDSKLSAKKMVSANTESPSASTQAQTASSKEQSTVPVIVTIQPLDSTTPAPSPATATTGLNRRRTLKDLAPSIRSLARRCSSRFSSNNSSSRPNSFAGSSSDPMVQFADGKALEGGNNSLLMTTSYLPLKLSLTSLPRSLVPGPDGIVDLQQAASPSSSSLSVKYFPPASASTPSLSLSDMVPSPPQKEQQEQRVPVHRKVTLFRSKTLSLAKSSLRLTSSPPTSHADDTIDTTPSNGMTAADDHDDDYNNNNNNNNNRNSSTRANSLPSRRRRQRDSLRLANGHGLDFDTFLPPTTTDSNVPTSSAEDEVSAVEKSTNDLESALPGAGLGRSTTPPVLPAIVTTGSRFVDMEQQQKARRQIISLLAMGRKDRISAKTGHSMKSGSSTASSPTTPTTASTLATTLSQLSPLALEAQEDLFVTPATAEEKEGGEEDPCEKIAFMLVPKSRYEFQPLVVA